jgi:nucleoporin NUP42
MYLNREDNRKDLEAESEMYTEEVRKAYEYLAREGRFEGGMMPAVPPLREWTSYDF